MKKFVCFFIMASLISTLIACGNKNYNDDLPCSEILDTVEEQIPIDLGYESYDRDHFKYYFGDTLSDDHALRYSVRSRDINEFGIFHATDTSSRDTLIDMTEKYLDDMLKDKRAFIESYAPEELIKLEEAEVKSFGNYVAYAILDEHERNLFFETIEAVLNDTRK